MISVASKGSRIPIFISTLTKKDFKTTLLCRHQNIYEIYRRGYIVTNKNSVISKYSREKPQLEKLNICFQHQFSTENDAKDSNFIEVSNETLEYLTEYFDELIEKATHLQDADVSYGDGVLTIKFGPEYGTYVINRQVPNQQIWLSSPKSGPKRYDFINGKWIYKHDGKSMNDLLNEEISEIVKMPVSFPEHFESTDKKL